MLYYGDPDMRFLGARMLLHIDQQTYLPRVLHLLSDEHENIRGSFAMILARYKDPRAVPALIAVLQNDPDDTARVLAAEALGETGDPRAILALKWAVEHDAGVGWEDQGVAETAQSALDAIQNKQSDGGSPRRPLP